MPPNSDKSSDNFVRSISTKCPNWKYDDVILLQPETSQICLTNCVWVSPHDSSRQGQNRKISRRSSHPWISPTPLSLVSLICLLTITTNLCVGASLITVNSSTPFSPELFFVLYQYFGSVKCFSLNSYPIVMSSFPSDNFAVLAMLVFNFSGNSWG